MAGSMRITLSGTPDFRIKAENGSGYSFDIGASKAIGGDESGFRPMETVLAALGSCSGIDVISILKKSRQNFTDVKVVVEGERAEGVPSPFRAIHLTFIVNGTDLDRAKAEKAVSLSVEKYCSVAMMLIPTVVITHSVELRTPVQAG